MKERYTLAEPFKVGMEVTLLFGKTVFEAVKPQLKRKLARDGAQFVQLFLRK